ncbi:transposase InsE [Salmonella enterica subsp. enterica serovar Montevideo str. S5-403]|uniref:Transposase InsE n=1 Tax=Salmonella enterica subsp. enterica serovar Montevideo str. S5-403 TaxID=913242 RepID=G5QCG9_SALMO|nr:transposase InsE [Salmonella enterica subsp. enterica serovar Montevideo str. S5-403]
MPRLTAPRRQAEVCAPLPAAHAAARYARHLPERTLLYALVQAHYPDFIARLEAEDRPLPEYVREEFETYLRCGGEEFETYLRCGARFPARGVRAVPGREAGGLLLQEARLLPQLRGAAHGRERAAPGGGGVWPAAGAAMGAEFSVPAALPVRQQAGGHRPGAGHRASCDRRLVGRSSRRRPRQRAMRRGDPDPALRQRAEPECSLPHAVARRRVRGHHRASAAQAAPAPHPCAHIGATDGTGRHHRASRVPAPVAPRLARRRRRIRVPVRQRG